MNQEQKIHLLKKAEQISELFDEIHDLLSDETTYAMADGLDALSAEIVPYWDELFGDAVRSGMINKKN